jgi:hypothetical protein
MNQSIGSFRNLKLIVLPVVVAVQLKQKQVQPMVPAPSDCIVVGPVNAAVAGHGMGTKTENI